jgi:ABC-type transporter Mla MlaB component
MSHTPQRSSPGVRPLQPDMPDQTGSGDLELLHVQVHKAPGTLCVLIDGEVDFCTLGQLGLPLSDVVLDDGVLVQVDLTHLSFADGAALRLLGGFASQARRAGHCVRTSGASQTLRKAAAILDVADDLGLT